MLGKSVRQPYVEKLSWGVGEGWTASASGVTAGGLVGFYSSLSATGPQAATARSPTVAAPAVKRDFVDSRPFVKFESPSFFSLSNAVRRAVYQIL